MTDPSRPQGSPFSYGPPGPGTPGPATGPYGQPTGPYAQAPQAGGYHGQQPWAQPTQPTRPRAGRDNDMVIRMLVAVPLTLFGGLVLLLISVVPVVALDDELSTTAENWIPIILFTLLVAAATVVARLIARGWVPLDLPAWAGLFAALPVLDQVTAPFPDEGLVYVLVMLLLALGTLVRLVFFHVYASKSAAKRRTTS
jgi:hypothetical protein